MTKSKTATKTNTGLDERKLQDPPARPESAEGQGDYERQQTELKRIELVRKTFSEVALVAEIEYRAMTVIKDACSIAKNLETLAEGHQKVAANAVSWFHVLYDCAFRIRSVADETRKAVEK